MATFTDTDRTVQLTAIYPVHEAHVFAVLHGQQPDKALLVTVVPGDCVTTGQKVNYTAGGQLDTKSPSVLLLSGTSTAGVYAFAPWDVIPEDQYDAEITDGHSAAPIPNSTP